MHPAVALHLLISGSGQSELQDLPGEHQDAATASVRQEAFAASVRLTEDSRGTLLTLGRLLQLEADRMQRCQALFPAAWADYRAATDDLQ
ncbi:MAG: hypothetical protein AAGG11_12540 [Pseudomonadota bacterium]